MNNNEPPSLPFEEPEPKGPPDASVIANKVSTPAVLLIIMACLSILFNLFSMATNNPDAAREMLESPMYQDFFEAMEIDPAVIEDAMRMVDSPAARAYGLGKGLLGLLIYGFVIFGAVKMKRLESYKLAMTACILACIPCFTSCCCLEMIPGIWGLIVLTGDGVRATFS